MLGDGQMKESKAEPSEPRFHACGLHWEGVNQVSPCPPSPAPWPLDLLETPGPLAPQKIHTHVPHLHTNPHLDRELRHSSIGHAPHGLTHRYNTAVR